MKKAISLLLLTLTLFVLSCTVSCETTPPATPEVLTLSIENNVLSVCVGESVQLVCKSSKNPDADAKGVTFVVEEGGEDASVDQNGVLTVADGAAGGGRVTVVAKAGEVESNRVTLSIAKPLTEIIANAGTLELTGDGFAFLSATLLPADATEKGFAWVIAEGAEHCQITENVFTFKDAPIGATAKVKAVCGAVESNVLTFTRVASELENTYFISFEQDRITLDSMSDTANKKLVANLINAAGLPTEDIPVVFEIVGNGSDYVDIAADGTLTPKAHGQAEVWAMVNGKKLGTATVNVVIPPVALAIPEVFAERSGYEYSIGTQTPVLTENIGPIVWNYEIRQDNLPFAVSPVGEGVCRDFNILFELVSEDALSQKTPSSEIAVYNEDNTITFKKQGKIRVVAVSDSGSRVETRTSYVFDVNDYLNIHDHHTLKVLMNMLNTSKTLSVNITVFDRVKGQTDSGEKDYGYALVPTECLKPISKQSPYEQFDGEYGSKLITYGSMNINGNRHSINVSNTRPIKETDNVIVLGTPRDTYLAVMSFSADESSILHTVNLRDLDFFGEHGIDYNGNGNGHLRALQVGKEADANYTINFKNINISGFRSGARIMHTVNSTVENIKIDNIYANGLEFGSSLITLKNLTLGKCGAVGIELVPEESNRSGINYNETQKVYFEGNIKITSIENGSAFNNAGTKYMTTWQSGVVPMLLQGIFPGYDAVLPTASSHMTDADNNTVFIGLVFNAIPDVNASVWNYVNADVHGIVTMDEIVAAANGSQDYIDTVHQFIIVNIPVTDVVAGALGLPSQIVGASLGTIMFYNMNYQPQ